MCIYLIKLFITHMNLAGCWNSIRVTRSLDETSRDVAGCFGIKLVDITANTSKIVNGRSRTDDFRQRGEVGADGLMEITEAMPGQGSRIRLNRGEEFWQQRTRADPKIGRRDPASAENRLGEGQIGHGLGHFANTAGCLEAHR